ncbi:hydantoinase B/oxoprolinase family protein [Sphingobium boeckii]|uniref:N-methylhydantoinase B n=1 Tax=Sphingobium boeckii TaxID=1082345 RepID=A0A7W9AFN6_9SPHN|nr:hydantoinase B/oxoprolinase family protein [Sphingobium boeckii]MBB5684805.1 N-methylhydantoinase B [Sphingobium boeckii]
MTEQQLSGARLAVLRSRIDGIARKMSNAVLRAGRSGVLNRAKDLSCAIVTPGCDLLSAADSLPIHVLSGPDLMARVMHDFHPVLRAGDAFLHNSPYHGCSHAADHTILVPVIDETGVHRFTVMVKAHQADIGDSAPTTYFAGARDVYEEGALIFPAVKIQEDYVTNEDIVRMCRARIRVPDQWHGDFLAMVGAARTGEKELLSLGRELGWDVLEAFSRQWLDYGQRRVETAIAALPAGEASGQSTHDPMPGTPAEGVTIKASVKIDPEARRILVDLRDNIDVLPCGLNVSEACARTAALIGVFNSLGADIPKNAGSLSRVEVLIRENSVAGGGQHPVSFSVATTNIADRIVAAVQIAMGVLCPSAGIAEVGSVNPPHKGVISGNDPITGHPFINQLFLGSTGGPGSAHGDAWLTYSHAGNGGLCFVDSIEMAELHHPIRVLSRQLLIDTEGAGRFCGAPSLEVELGPKGGDVEIAYISDGVINPAQGTQHGGPGGRADQAKREASGQITALPPIGRLLLHPGEAVVSTGAGGGGFGDPHQRDPRLVARDVRDRRISTERAAVVYGVALDDFLQIDAARTAQFRAKGPR